MTYDNIREGVFRSRPNHFIAEVEIGGRIEICHVKNTGRRRGKGVCALLRGYGK